jgi:hypothetical protein
MASDPRPCRGDAFRMAYDGHGQTCEECCRSESRGGKCAGENRWYFMLCLLGPLREWLDEHPELDDCWAGQT